MKRVYNFSAGPAMMPTKVLEELRDEMLSYGETGMSVMEMSHRSSDYLKIFNQAKEDLIDIMEIPNNYKVIFVQGGASMQFAMIPMNLMLKHKKIQAVDSGAFASKAIKEAKLFGQVDVVASSKEDNYKYIPSVDKSKIDEESDYFYITTNNTIFGTAYKELPDTKGLALVADMSSNILSAPINVSDYGLIFAGAQKNMGPAGFALVIIREDLVDIPGKNLPTMLDYRTYVEKDSMFNTPPTYSLYAFGKVLKWIKSLGGLEVLEKMNLEKANILYDYLDNNNFYQAVADKDSRSLMNVTFFAQNDDLNKKFVDEASRRGLTNLKGHRSVGGMRASIYNAMPLEGVKKLVEFMKDFERKNI